jgi:hypothetical protein
MKHLNAVQKLRHATLELTDAAGELCAVAVALGEPEIEKLLAQAIRVASCVSLGIDARDPADAEECFSEARGAAAALAARIHIAVSRGVVHPQTGLMIRLRIRTVVDEIDVQRYRRRRMAG